MSDVLVMVKVLGRPGTKGSLRGSAMKGNEYETTTFTSQSGALDGEAGQLLGFCGQVVVAVTWPELIPPGARLWT